MYIQDKPTKVICIDGPPNIGVEGYAEGRLLHFENMRQSLGLPYLSRLEPYSNNILVKYIVCDGYMKAMYWGGGALPLILFYNGSNYHEYDYYSDKLQSVLSYSGSGNLVPIYNGRSQLGEIRHATYRDRWTQGDASGQNHTFLGGINNHEMAIFKDGNNIYGRIGSVYGGLATFQQAINEKLSGPYGSLFNITTTPQLGWQGGSWNLFGSSVLYTFNPANKNINETWYWVPSFFLSSPADESGLTPGFYYGKKPVPEHEYESPWGTTFSLDEAHVKLKAILDSRYTTSEGAYKYGWAEMLVSYSATSYFNQYTSYSVNETPYRIFFYINTGMQFPSTETLGYYRTVGTIEDTTYWVGSMLDGYNATFYEDVAHENVEVVMWNHSSWGTQDTAVTYALIDGQSAVFKKWNGLTRTVLETTKYHSHSTSRDGTVLAVFESDDGNIISGIKVYDLYGVREARADTNYTAGGFTELRDSVSVASITAFTGCVIPNRASGIKDEDVNSPSYDLATSEFTQVSLPAYNPTMPSLSLVSFFKRATVPPSISKITCSNGIDAYFGQSSDTCFDSTFVLEDPDLGVNDEHLVGWWDAGGIFKGVVRGEFVGEHPNMKFVGEGDGWIPTITRNDELLIFQDSFGRLSVERGIGTLTWGSCVDESLGYPRIDPSCYDTCEAGSFDVTASTSCGQSGGFTVETNEPDELVITEPSDKINGNWWTNRNSTPPSVVVGDAASASGGVAPYEWSGSGLTIDPDSGVITSIDANGCSATISVTDFCGSTDSVSVATNSGGWVLSTSNSYYYSSASACCAYIASTFGVSCSHPTGFPWIPPGYDGYSRIACEETPYGTNWTCTCPGAGCVMNPGSTWTTDRSQTSKTVITYAIGYCPSSDAYIVESESIYVWSC